MLYLNPDNYTMKKILFQLSDNQLGYLEAEDDEIEKLIRQLRQEGHSIRLVNDAEDIARSLPVNDGQSTASEKDG